MLLGAGLVVSIPDEHFVIAESSVSEVTSLLRAQGLPTADLVEERVEILAARDHFDGIIGCVGIERHGPFALLRSLAVARGHRRRGIGGELVEAALQRAER